MPEKFYPENDDGERIQREIGFHKIGYCRDLPASRRQPTGVYYHDMWCTDPKTNWLLRKLGGPFIVNAKAKNFQDLYNFAKKEHVRLAAEIAGKDITQIGY